MAKTTTGHWGIDIGQCALKAVRLEVQDGKPVATAYDYIEHPKILSQPDADPDALTREALEKFLSRNPLGRDQVGISIAGQSGLARFVKLPPVEEKKIPEIVKFEAKQQIPFPLDEVVWDYQKIAGGEAVGGFAMETEIGLFAMKRDVIARALAPFSQTKTEVHLVQMAPLALCNFATYEVLKKGGPDPIEAEGAPLAEGEENDTPKGKKRCAVVLDIGTDASNLIITDGGKIIWQRPVPLGGNHFTRALTKELKLTFAKAEHLKRNAAKSPDLAQILRALRPVLTEFVGEVQRSLGYFTNTHRDAHVAYMVGLGNAFRLPGLQKYLTEKLSLDVRKPARLDRVAGDAVLTDPNFQENLLTFPVALGLALQSLQLARLQTNLLPQEIRVERLIRAKKPWAAAAAASLLVGTAGVALGYAVQYSSVTAPDLLAAVKTAEDAVEKQKAQEKQRQTKVTELDDTKAQVKSIIAGNDERLNWVRLNEVVTAALPRPADPDAKTGDPKANLNEPQQIAFWQHPDATDAFRKYKQRMSEGIPVEKVLDDNLSSNLAMVNIETVYTRYTADLAAFLTNADNYVKQKYGNDIADSMLESEREEDTTNSTETLKRFMPKAPEGDAGGWVVELRGYTYHKGGADFVKKCLVRNLQRINEFAQHNHADPNPRNPKVKGTDKVGQVIPGVPDPIARAGAADESGAAAPPVSTISHAFLLFCQPAPQAPGDSGNFAHINQSFIDGLISGSLTAAAAGGPGGPMSSGPPAGILQQGMPGGGAAAAWQPLWGGASAAGPGPSGGPMGSYSGPMGGGSSYSGPVGGGGGRGNRGLPPELSGGASIPSPPGGSAGGTGAKQRERYEFVICFIWREPNSTPAPDGSTSGTEADTAPAAPARPATYED